MNETLTPPVASLIGQRIPKMDAPEKASGRTRYIDDITLPGQLYAAILRSERVHARILRIDVSRARALPGVHAVITAADVPDQRPIGVAKDHLPLKTDRVRPFVHASFTGWMKPDGTQPSSMSIFISSCAKP